MDTISYLTSFRILSNDYNTLSEYIDFNDNNLSTYSKRIYELFLRVCTEFESACKEKIIEDGILSSAENISHYKELETTLSLDDVEFAIPFWRSSPRRLKPFKDWYTATPSLKWYQSYNKVKHNRVSEFNRANLKNVSTAICGLFALLVKLNIITAGTGFKSLNHGTERELVYPGQLFTIYTPNSTGV